MSAPPIARLAVLALLCVASAAAAMAQVVINEISAAQSDRLLQHPPGGLPKLGALPAWYENGYIVPTWWKSGAGPFGFGYTQTTNVQSAVRNRTPVLYLRRDFTVSSQLAGSPELLQLAIDYDDGFVAYLNGVEVARRNTGAVGSFAWHNQQAFNAKSATGAETITLAPASGLLREGTNVLAIQVHNRDETDGTLFCAATLRIAGASPVNLVLPSHTWRWFAGTHEPAGGLYDAPDLSGGYAVGPNWTQPEYGDAAWQQGAGALGFDVAQDYRPQLGTNLTGMLNTAISLYMRRDFTITEAQYEALTGTSMTVDWDDGHVLYLNGYEISRRNLPGAAGTLVPHTQAATVHPARRDSGGDDAAAVISVTIPRNLLRPGRNVLSAQVHNSNISDADLLLDVRFSATSGSSTLQFVQPGSSWRYRIGTSEIGSASTTSVELIAPEFLDWVELKNLGQTPVDLGGWRLTDRAADPTRWIFPAGTIISPGGFLVVACSGRNVTAPPAGGLLHTNFSLGAKGEYLALHDAVGVIQGVITSPPPQNYFHTWGMDAGSGTYRYLPLGTPGAENTAGMASGQVEQVAFSHPSGFHAAPLTVSLSSETPGAVIRYTLNGTEPSESNGLVYSAPFNPAARPVIGPGAGTILREVFQWSSGTTVLPANLPANATPTSTQLISSLESPSNTSDYYTQRVRGYLHAPQSGTYEFWLATDDDGELWLSTSDSPAGKRRIAYITGWTSPREWTRYSTQKSVPITLVAGQRYYIEVLQSEGGGGDNLAVGWSGPGLPAGINVITGQYLSPPETLPPGTVQQSAFGTVRARAFAPGKLPSEVGTRTYVTDVDPRLTGAPALFLTGPPAEAFYSPNGIFSQVGGTWSGSWTPNNSRFDYNFAMVSGSAFERPVGLEIVNPGNQVYERTTVGARFAGSVWSRPRYDLRNLEHSAWSGGWEGKPQLNIFFRSDFGISKLRKPGFIPTSRIAEWDELRLRAGKNDPYNPFIVDEWMRRSFAAMGAPSPQGMFATLFINGHFKGYFNPTERIREAFFQEFYQSPNAWDVNYIGDWESGDSVAYNWMFWFFRNTDFGTVSNYQQGAAYWDMTNVADYFIANAWAANGDWPHNNYAFARERITGGKWRFSMWDAEYSLNASNQHNTFEQDLLVPENGTRSPSIGSDGTITRLVFRRAYQSAEFRLLFADRLQKHFYNGGVMTAANRNARWNAMRTQVAPLIAAASGGQFNDGFWSNWSGRDSVFFQQCRNLGLWPATAAPSMSPFGGTVSASGRITLSNPNSTGTIYYTTNGSDPRAVEGAPQGSVYSTPLSVSGAITLKARVRSSAGEWSPLVEAEFAPTPPAIRITEINYNPPGADDLTEFVKLTNTSREAASLSRAQFTDGIQFTFGELTLQPGQSAVVIRDAAAFSAAYPGVAFAGVFSGALSNEGETLTLRDLLGNVLATVTYGSSVANGWPASTSGGGYSLVLRQPLATTTDPALASSWRASGTRGGSPGSLESTTFTGNPLTDGDRDGVTALVEYAMGSSDADPLLLPRIETSRDAFGHAVVSFTRPAAADDVIIDALESSDLTAWGIAVFEREIHDSPGLMRAYWRSAGTGEQIFLKLRVRK